MDPIFFPGLEILKNRSAEQAKAGGAVRMPGYLRMQLPAQGRLLLPRLCAAALCSALALAWPAMCVRQS